MCSDFEISAWKLLLPVKETAGSKILWIHWKSPLNLKAKLNVVCVIYRGGSNSLLGIFFFLCYLGELNLQLCRLAKRCTDAHVVLPTTTKPSVSSVFLKVLLLRDLLRLL